MTKVKIPKEIKVGVYTYTIIFKPHLHADFGVYGRLEGTRLTIEIEPDMPDSIKGVTLLHELNHICGDVFAVKLDEPSNDSVAHCVAELLFNNLNIEFDWSLIT